MRTNHVIVCLVVGIFLAIIVALLSNCGTKREITPRRVDAYVLTIKRIAAQEKPEYTQEEKDELVADEIFDASELFQTWDDEENKTPSKGHKDYTNILSEESVCG